MATWGPAITMLPTLPPSPNDADMIGLLVACLNFQAATPLVHVNLDLDVPSSTYQYRILAVDGRRWNQDYDPSAPPSNPLFSTSTTGDKWELSEVNLHREIRTVVQRLLAKFSPTSIRVTF